MPFNQRYINTRAQIIQGTAEMFTETHGSNQAEIDIWNAAVTGVPGLCQAVFGASDPGDPRRQIQIKTVISGAVHNDTGRIEINVQRVSTVGSTNEIAASLAVTPDMKYPPPP